MGRTAQMLVAGSIRLPLASSAATPPPSPPPGPPGGPGGRSPPLVSASPAVFAERVTAAHQGAGGGGLGSLQNAIELIVLAGVCAVGVAFYSAASSQRDGTRVPV